MSYNKRTWTDGQETVTYEDFNRIENGIEASDKALNGTGEGSVTGLISNHNVSQTAHQDIRDKINVLMQYRGIITSLNQANKDGYYYVNLGDTTFPYAYGIVTVKTGNGEKSATYETTGNDRITYKNTLRAGQTVWDGWQQLVTDLNNNVNFDKGNTKPSDYINKFKANGARKSSDLGVSQIGYWANVFGINNYNGDTVITEFAAGSYGIAYRQCWNHADRLAWNRSWIQIATHEKTVYTLTPVNNYVATGNNICRVTSLGNGTSLLELELKANANIPAFTNVCTLPAGCRPKSSFQPFFVPVGASIYGGYAYNDGQVKVGVALTTGQIITVSALIIN